MTRTALETLAAVKQESEHPTLPAESGWCLKYCRIQAAVPARYLTAYQSAIHANPLPSAPPAGSFVYWKNQPIPFAGHIAIADGTGWCYSTDIYRIGRFDRIPIDLIRSKWGLAYMGWSYTVNDVEMPHGQEQEGGGDPLPPEDDMFGDDDRKALAIILQRLGSKDAPETVLGNDTWEKQGLALLARTQVPGLDAKVTALDDKVDAMKATLDAILAKLP